jgi:LmbE family N-acetylglucosaminyl deacetylase
MPQDWSRAVAIVAHPDGLEYGVASAVARWTGQGKSAAYVLASSGEAGIAGQSSPWSVPARSSSTAKLVERPGEDAPPEAA